MEDDASFSIDPEDLAPKVKSEDLDLIDEEGNTFQWEVFYSFSLSGNDYMVFLPTHDSEYKYVNVEIDDPDSDVPGYIVLRLESEEITGDELLVEITEPDELEEVSEYVVEEIGILGLGTKGGE